LTPHAENAALHDSYLLGMANGLCSAARYASRDNRLVMYNPKNRTMSDPNPAPRFRFKVGIRKVGPLVARDGWLPLPSVYPLDWKAALAFAGPFAASEAARPTALRRPLGSAPRIV